VSKAGPTGLGPVTARGSARRGPESTGMTHESITALSTMERQVV